MEGGIVPVAFEPLPQCQLMIGRVESTVFDVEEATQHSAIIVGLARFNSSKGFKP